MTSSRQIESNQLNARKSTGPRTQEGKARTRQNAIRHGLTAETVIPSLENARDYEVFEATIFNEYQPHTPTCRELVARLASVLWRLRRSTTIETGLMQMQGELMRSRNSGLPQRRLLLPEWYDELDVAPTGSDQLRPIASQDNEASRAAIGPQELAYCFLQASRLQFGAFETLTRYETALWRQAVQLTFMLQSRARANS